MGGIMLKETKDNKKIEILKSENVKPTIINRLSGKNRLILFFILGMVGLSFFVIKFGLIIIRDMNISFLQFSFNESHTNFQKNIITEINPQIEVGYSTVDILLGIAQLEDSNGNVMGITNGMLIPPDSGSIISTGEGLLGLSLPDGSKVYLDKETTIELKQVADPRGDIINTVLELKKGDVLIIVNLVEKFSFHVLVPTGGWSKVVGSIMGVRYDPNNNHLFLVDCIEGHCQQGGKSNSTIDLIGGENGFLESLSDPQPGDCLANEIWSALAISLNINGLEFTNSCQYSLSAEPFQVNGDGTPIAPILQNSPDDSIIPPTWTPVSNIYCYSLYLDSNNGNISASPSPNCPIESGKYLAGTEVNLIANSTSGYYFDYWSGNLIGGNNPATIIMNQNKTIRAEFTPNSEEYSLIINFLPSGISAFANPPAGKYQSGTNLSLKVSSIGYYLNHWSGAASGSHNPLNLYMDGDKELTANLEKCIGFKTKLFGPGGNRYDFDYDAVNCLGDSLIPGSLIKLVALPGPGATFTGWDLGPCTGVGDCIFTLTSDTIIRANFEYCSYFTLSIKGSGTVNIPPSNNSPDCYYVGTSIGIEAVPNAGYNFDHWEGACSGEEKTCQVNLDTDKSVTAVFAPASCFTVSASSDPSEGGTVTVQTQENCSSGGSGYDLGTNIIINESTNPSYIFNNWSGCSGGSGSCSFTINTNTNISANYTKCSLLLTYPVPTDGGTVNVITSTNCSGGLYLPGTSVNLTANPNPGYYFKKWGNSETSSSTTIQMNTNMDFPANFNQCYQLTLTANGSGGLTVSPESNCSLANYYLPNTFVTINVTPDEGYQVDSWNGGCSDINDCSFIMDSINYVTVDFVSSNP